MGGTNAAKQPVIGDRDRVAADSLTKKNAKRTGIPVPRFVSPMKATAVTELPKGDEWIYEVKWDGYRALALKHDDDVRLLSLKQKDLTYGKGA
jgi:bifunctional non-homologous end joining protein LigD